MCGTKVKNVWKLGHPVWSDLCARLLDPSVQVYRLDPSVCVRFLDPSVLAFSLS